MTCSCAAPVPPRCVCEGSSQVCPDACFYSCAKQERVKAGDSKLHKKNDYKFIIPNELTTTTEGTTKSLLPSKPTAPTLIPVPVAVPVSSNKAASSQSHSGNARPLPAPAVMLPPELVVVPMPVKMKSLCVNEFIVPAKVHFIYADTRLATYESVLQFWVCIIVREKGRGQATLIGAFRPPVTPTCLN
ncbi:hypothetical protein Y032_0065g3665 [Ancylostoma ceylanicum]|uniref:Uncharacterized protein n=1 Tax=Ancylostoma ceylanicum TaxID=53326 RepID=A0A016U025_9BILA|nr:hypothetical protein Y032_0065g3665 [Ancylostoma ceylanicum]